MHSTNHEFAITDVETTGLFPERSDRVLEIAIIRINHDGAKLKEYTTLINPMRDVGPTEIHGVRARDLKEAPTFDEIAGDVASVLAGAVIVAHNAVFDVRFLNSEFRRASLSIPKLPYVCTMHLAQSISTPPPGRGLECACDYLGLNKSPDHSAYTDADATVSLFNYCLQEIKERGDFSWERIGLKGAVQSINEWPKVPCSGKSCRRGTTARKQ
ncbi:MAG: 3'-5' exonuclease, partial [Sedimentisphaerales bacterium]|nr:3'-5' exonuclease [Sedimentisphaerales bacterium]